MSNWRSSTSRVTPPPTDAIGGDTTGDGDLTFFPERYARTYHSWHEGIRDWCISRQLWWGHRIPVWYCADCNEITVAREDPTECAHCGSAETAGGSVALKPCSRCKAVVYCGRECQAAHWKAGGHRAVCKGT